MKVSGRMQVLRGRMVSGGPDDPQYLAVFEEVGQDDRNPVLQVRLRHEVMIDGKERPFLIDSQAASAVEKRMEELGRRVQVDRIYVFTIDHKEQVFDNVLEWCAEGIAPHIEDLKGIPMSGYPWWINRIMKEQWIRVEDTLQMPRNAVTEMEILEAQGIRAVLVAPLVVGGAVTGFVGFDQNDTPRIWHDQELGALEDFKAEIEQALAESMA